LAADEPDTYGRAVIYAWLRDGTTINERLLEEGHASVVSGLPDLELESRFANAETRALQRGVGIWRRCAPR
jgi:micrococcal nuclease